MNMIIMDDYGAIPVCSEKLVHELHGLLTGRVCYMCIYHILTVVAFSYQLLQKQEKKGGIIVNVLSYQVVISKGYLLHAACIAAC